MAVSRLHLRCTYEHMKAKLTPQLVKAAKPEATPYEIHDTDLKGLLLRVQPSGAKSYVVTWGRGKRRTLKPPHPVMTVTGAREAALTALAEAAKHGAPLAVIEANKPASEKPITLGDFISDHYAPWAKTHQKAGQATIDALEAVFGDLYEREMRSLDAHDIEQIKTGRLSAGKKPATVNRDLDRIRSVFSRAVEWKFLAIHPLKSVKRAKGVDNSRVRYLSEDEERRLRDALARREVTRRKHRESGNEWCRARGGDGRPLWPADGFTDHLMPLVLVAMNTGLRRGELFGLRWDEINLSDKILTVTAGNAKSRKARHVHLNAEAVSVLTRWKAQGDGTGLAFPSPSGGRFDNINKAWDNLTEDAELVGFRFHDLRHDFASKLVMAGVDLYSVKELLGHASIEMTQRYAHLAPHKLAEAVARIGSKQYV